VELANVDFLHSIGAEANGKPTKKEKEKEHERAFQVNIDLHKDLSAF
jgi:hypothetical protein